MKNRDYHFLINHLSEYVCNGHIQYKQTEHITSWHDIKLSSAAEDGCTWEHHSHTHIHTDLKREIKNHNVQTEPAAEFHLS